MSKRNFYNQILEIAENNNGIITSKMCRQHNIPNVYLTRLVEKGELEKAARGVYTNSWGLADTMTVLQSKHPKAIFCLETALSLHDLIDTLTNTYEIVVPKGHRISPEHKNVICYQKTSNNYNLGLITLKNSIGNKVRCYDMERTICDIIINQDKITNENFTKAIHNYIKNPKKDNEKLIKYSKILKIEKEINLVMRVANG